MFRDGDIWQHEEVLKGWNGVVRIGDTIRRPARRSSQTVQALLCHLEALGFDGAPKALGFDEQGREILSYIPGSAEHYPWRAFVYSEDNLCKVARLLREYHEATASFRAPDDATWLAEIAGPAEVVCHGDIGPYNTIYVEQQAVAFIDFETAAPAPRVWDIAFAVYRFARLCELSNIVGVSDAYLDRVAQRIRRFCDYYGFQDRIILIDAVLQRLEYQIAWMSSPEHVKIQQRATAEEHLAFYRRDARAIARHAGRLGRYL
jgi:Ser/Thr protein kinase RdoA (MazF antagonist)